MEIDSPTEHCLLRLPNCKSASWLRRCVCIPLQLILTYGGQLKPRFQHLNMNCLRDCIKFPSHRKPTNLSLRPTIFTRRRFQRSRILRHVQFWARELFDNVIEYWRYYFLRVFHPTRCIQRPSFA